MITTVKEDRAQHFIQHVFISRSLSGGAQIFSWRRRRSSHRLCGHASQTRAATQQHHRASTLPLAPIAAASRRFSSPAEYTSLSLSSLHRVVLVARPMRNPNASLSAPRASPLVHTVSHSHTHTHTKATRPHSKSGTPPLADHTPNHERAPGTRRRR